MAPRVLLVPFPVTPLVAFAHFLLTHLGMIAPSTAVRYRATAGSGFKAAVLGNGAVHDITGLNLCPYIESLIAGTAEEKRWILRRLLTYCADGDPQRGHRLNRWLTKLQLTAADPTMVLERAAQLFETWRTLGADPWRQDLEIPESACTTAPVPRAYPPDKRFGTLPIFKQEEGRVKPGEHEIIAAASYELAEGLIYELTTAHLAIAVGGPAGSGKSTLTASLAAEMRHQIASLATRRGWEGFSLTVEVADLDLATPTVDAITAGVAKRNRDAIKDRKRRWTEALALKALDAFVAAKSRANIVIADLPGGPIDAITEIVAAPADVAILITRDWSLMKGWQDFMRRMGIPTIAQARSRSSDEEVGFTSVVTRYHHGRIIAGRVVDLDRMERSWDRFNLWVTESLLFDLLPATVIKRREKLEQLLRSLERS